MIPRWFYSAASRVRVRGSGIASVACVLLSLAWAAQSSTIHEQDVRRLVISGSMTLYEPFEEIARAFVSRRSDVRAVNRTGSSTSGIHALIEGEVDVARSSRSLNVEDLALAMGRGVALRAILIGEDRIVVAIHPEKSRIVSAISFQDVRRIFFDGTITSWERLDPRLEGPIHLYVRDASDSGTAALFARYVAGDSAVPFTQGARFVRQTRALREAVAVDPDGMTFLPADMLDERVRTLRIEGRDDGPEGGGLLKRPLYLIVREPLSPLVNDFVFFAKGGTATSILHRYGIDTGRL